MQIRYKILKVKDVFEKVLKEVTCDLRTWVLNKSVKSNKKVLQELKSVWKSPPAENPHQAESSQSTRNASKLIGCKETGTRGDLKTDQSIINTCYFLI